MAETINWNFLSRVVNGPAVSGSGQMDLEAYEKIDFILTTDDHPITISSVSKITQLIIGSSKYDEKITYTGDPAISVAKCKLDGPHVFIGQMAQDFLKRKDTTLKFSNSTGDDVDIQILIGRKTA